MQIARRSGNDWQAAHCSTASVLEFGGADRRERLVDAMNLFYRESDPRRALSALRALAMVELEDGDAPRAVTIHAAVDRIGAQVGIVLDAKLEGEREAAWARLEDALDPEALVAAREMGKGWSLEALMSFAAGAASS
jgi:hypothetical protein